jgi:phosphodiesterase/alkaline phosphatase D-like protein
MYRYHWSFTEMQAVMRSYPHLLMWDDHEIRNGWGNEGADFEEGNQAMFRIAREVAEEYILNVGPRVRERGNAHEAYVSGSQAAFILDARSSRVYAEPGGRILSEEQLADFRSFNRRIAADRRIRFYLLGASVPFVYLKGWAEDLAAGLSRTVSRLLGEGHEVMRDSWNSPGNRAALGRLLDELRSLHLSRPDLRIVIISGDLHMANAFEIRPPGFRRPFHQVTTSALTNRQHLPKLVSKAVAVGDYESDPQLGAVRRIWEDIRDPNVLCVTTSGDRAVLRLRVLPVDGSDATDQRLVLS